MGINIQPIEFQSKFQATLPAEIPPGNGQQSGKVIPLHSEAPAKKGSIPETQLLKKYIQEKNEQALITTFYTGIVKYAKQKQFIVAERLREKLMELAPMALTEIVQTGEIIEQEKNAALDPEKMKPFADLFNQFSKSEATAFFFALKHRETKAHMPVFEQCQFDDQIYFIQSGRFILSYYDIETRQNIDFAILQKGDIAGLETFFSLTSHTTTLTPIEKGSISVLSKTAYEKILRDNPAIESKLHAFSGNRKKTCRIDHSRRQARRRYKRFPAALKGKFCKIDTNGRISREPVSINIVDISAGGLCFVMNNHKELDKEGLHKSWLRITAAYRKDSIIGEFSAIARVVSLQVLPFDDCSVHVQFKEPIEESKVAEIVGAECMMANLQ